MTDALRARLHDTAPGLPPQLRRAARWVLENPREVALLSMRAQARAAGVLPATMTRLAQALGLEGFEALRAAHAASLRRAAPALAAPAQGRRTGDGAEMAAAMLAEGAAHLAGLADPPTLAALETAAGRIATARRVFCLGQRSSFPIAWHLAYALGLIGAPAVLLDGAGGTGLDALHGARTRDVVLAVGVRPYTRAVVAATDRARARGATVIALTDHALSPLTRADETALIVPTAGPGVLHAMTPAFAAAETLVALVARAGGAATLARLHGLEAQLAALNTWTDPAEDTADA